MEPVKPREDRTTLTGIKARSGRIVERGAVLRILVISSILVIVLLFGSYLLLSG
jgi:hypothetical protein